MYIYIYIFIYKYSIIIIINFVTATILFVLNVAGDLLDLQAPTTASLHQKQNR